MKEFNDLLDTIELQGEEIERLQSKVNRLIGAFDTLAQETASRQEWIDHFGFYPDDFEYEEQKIY